MVFSRRDPRLNRGRIQLPAGGSTFSDCHCPALGPIAPLWVTGNTGSADPRLRGFSAAQLLASNADSPAIELVLNYGAGPGPIAEAPHQLVADCSGNLWIQAFAGGGTRWRVWKFAATDLLASGTIAPVLTLTGAAVAPSGSGVVDHAVGLAFDPQCNLWIAARNTGTSRGIVQKIPASMLARTGSYVVEPPVSLHASAAIWYALDKDITFDAAGDMWLSSYAASPSISKVTLAQQQATNLAFTPAARWVGSNFGGPEGLAFDAAGQLWMADYNAGALKAFNTAGATDGNPAPAITITSAGNIAGPLYIKFDAAGNLWLQNYDNWRIMKFEAADLLTSGAKVPSVMLSWAGLAPAYGVVASFCFARG